MDIIKPVWLVAAEAYLGLKEVPGKGDNPTIVIWLAKLNAWWRDDLTPWCGTFVGQCMRESHIAIPKAWYRAKAWLDWGYRLDVPQYGCVVVFNRAGGGHVGIVVGMDVLGRLMVLGGNQSDRVSIAPFDRTRVAGYRWPLKTLPPNRTLPIIYSNGKSSSDEV